MSTIKENLKYTESHEWVNIENGHYTIGITDYAQHALGDIVFIEQPEVGKALEKGKPFGVIESIKSVNDIYAPISGTVTEINEDLSNSPESVNSNPFDSWIIKVKIDNESDANSLLDADAYKELCNE